MAESWVRLWSGMTTDPKWQTIARKSGQPRALVIALFTHLMLLANESEERGVIESPSIEDMASAMDCDEEAIEAILDAMGDRVISDGKLSGWDKRQPIRNDEGDEKSGAMSAAERKRNQRSREKESQKSAQSNNDVTQCHARHEDVTTCHAPEAEAEAEAESKTSLSVEAAAATCSSTGAKAETLLPPIRDPIEVRSTELAILLRQRGAQVNPGDPRLRSIAESGATDAQLLTALEIAQQRRADSGSTAPISAGFLASILPDVLTPPSRASPSQRSPRPDRDAGRLAAARSIFPEHFANEVPHERTIDADYQRLA